MCFLTQSPGHLSEGHEVLLLMLTSCTSQGFILTRFQLLCNALFLTYLLITFHLRSPINAFSPAIYVYLVQVPRCWQGSADISVRRDRACLSQTRLAPMAPPQGTAEPRSILNGNEINSPSKVSFAHHSNWYVMSLPLSQPTSLFFSPTPLRRVSE